MNLRQPIAIFLLASCCVLAADECSAQRHPARVSRRRQAPPVPTSNSSLAPRSLVRLVQATDGDLDNDLDDVLDSARDLLERMDEDNSGGDLDLDGQLDADRPLRGGSEAPKLPRTLDEYRKQKQQSALDNLRNSLDDDDGDALDLSSLPDDEDEIDDEDEELDSRYQDVTPRPIPRRRSRANIPATLGAILDDDEIDPCCEQEFCRRMWQCAGGRCLSWCDRMKRNMDRDKLLKNSCANPGCLRGPFDEPFICPKHQQPQDYAPYPAEPIASDCPPADGYGEGEYIYEGEQYDSFNQYDGGYVPGSDDYEVSPTEMDHSGDALELAPVPDDSISRRRSDSRR